MPCSNAWLCRYVKSFNKFVKLTAMVKARTKAWDIENLDQPIKEHLYFVIDNIIQNTKAKKALAS